MLNLRIEDIELLQHAKFVLEREYRSHYTIGQLAQKVGINEKKLKQGFKQLFQATPYRYLSSVRIERAKDLLGDTRLPIKRVAAIVGIRDDANFIRSFKRLTGQSPKEWRRCNCSKDIFSSDRMGENKVPN